MNTKIDIAGGSVVGRAHRRLGRGNQDAFAWRRTTRGAVAAICDGCGSGARSEVGAALGARLWTTALAGLIDRGAALDDPSSFLEARDAVLAAVTALAAAMGDDLETTVRDHFL